MKKSFFIFGLLFTVSLATVVFNSCSKDDEIRLPLSTLTLAVGEEFIVHAFFSGPNITIITWTSSNESVATVVDGKITAISAGTVVITAKAGNETAVCAVIVYDPFYDEGIVINGIKWATRNVAAPGTFAAMPESSGMFYQRNRKIGWSTTDPMINSNGDTVWNRSGNDYIFAWEKSNDPSPIGWRVPTGVEVQSLLDTDKVTSVWTTENGIRGRRFTDRTSGNSLFLPAVGYRCMDGMLYHAGSWSIYRCCRSQWDLGLGSFSYTGASVGAFGLSVRSVAE